MVLGLCGCGRRIPKHIKIEGKRRNLQNRTRCLACWPFKKPRISIDNKLRHRTNSKAWYLRNTINGVNPVTYKCVARKNFLIEKLGGTCILCGYNKTPHGLAFHHVNPKTKSFGLSTRELQKKFQIILKEVNKCVLVCLNCHAEIHAGFIDSEFLESKRTILAIGGSWNDFGLGFKQTST